MTIAAQPEIASFRDFARLVPCKPSWVTHLRDSDRLVLTEDGKRVRVAESLQRIEDTRDPAKAGVVARHAAARAATNAAGDGSTVAASAAAQAQDEGIEKPTAGFQQWRERNERAKALQAERENAVAEGKLMLADQVIDTVKLAVGVLRTRFESLADVLAPQVITLKDEAKARALIADTHEHALTELARQFTALAKEAA